MFNVINRIQDITNTFWCILNEILFLISFIEAAPLIKYCIQTWFIEFVQRETHVIMTHVRMVVHVLVMAEGTDVNVLQVI
jgi:hypothetical protein